MDVRKGQIDVELSRKDFEKSIREKLFFDPSFKGLEVEIKKVIEQSWTNYIDYHKSPEKKKAGSSFMLPDFELSIEWLETSRKLKRAELIQKNSKTPSKILVICASPRNDQTCPGEMSKTYRLAQLAVKEIKAAKYEHELLDLSRLTSEYGKNIFPCKSCVSTAMPLCHWPCSCYPNHALSQTNDWMSEIYEKWVSAHGIMIVTPVHWYQVPSTLKLMMDRLVCADGGNADQTSTNGKDPKKAKKIELAGWDYPKHLANRAFSVVVHGDAAGTGNVKRILVDWLHDMHLIQAGAASSLDRYIGYYEPYATSHAALDKDQDFQDEVKNSAKSLIEQVRLIRSKDFKAPDRKLKPIRQK
ncbi:MAG: flavodoxin family protein [Bdellovibrionaceae bacterium]|nr:flavodoxin family protein [Bdellovibrio sp.]